jgi:hypothetical protein
MTATLVPEGTKNDEAKTGPVTEVKQGLGGRAASGEPASSAAKSVSNPKGENRYARGTEDASAAILEGRKLHGRPTLSAALGINQSTCWRWENGKVQPGEVDAIKAAVKTIADMPAPEIKGKGAGSRVKSAVALIRANADIDPDFADELLKLLDPKS